MAPKIAFLGGQEGTQAIPSKSEKKICLDPTQWADSNKWQSYTCVGSCMYTSQESTIGLGVDVSFGAGERRIL